MVRVFAGTGSAAFAPTAHDTALHGRPTALSLADFDSDGHLDLAVAETGPNQHELGFGAGGALGFTLASKPVRDSDYPELAIAAFANGTRGGHVDALLQRSATTYALSEDGIQVNRDVSYGGTGLPAPGAPASCSVLEVSGGPLRLVALPGEGRLDRWNGANYPTSLRLGPSPVRVAGADLDGDGVVDLVGADADGSLQVRLGAGGAQWLPAVGSPGTTTPVAVVTGDVGGDPRPDVVLVDADGTVRAMITQ